MSTTSVPLDPLGTLAEFDLIRTERGDTTPERLTGAVVAARLEYADAVGLSDSSELHLRLDDLARLVDDLAGGSGEADGLVEISTGALDFIARSLQDLNARILAWDASPAVIRRYQVVPRAGAPDDAAGLGGAAR